MTLTRFTQPPGAVYVPPIYARDMLFQLTQPERFRLVWGGAEGPTLAFWLSNNAVDRWDGRVILGGFIERLHALVLDDQEFVVAELVGGPLPAGQPDLLTLSGMGRGVFTRLDDGCRKQFRRLCPGCAGKRLDD